MPSKIFVNLPVSNLQRSIEFFTHVGFSFNDKFTDENSTCMIVSEHIYVMLLTGERFRDFTSKELCDTGQFTEVILALDAESREEVNTIADKAMAAGAEAARATEDYGWMYLRSFQDPDGHLWEVFHMDESAMPAS